MSEPALPQKTREYNDHPVIDGTRWRVYGPREGDIIITTSYKAGTTWMQTIVANLLHQDGNIPAAVSELSPWLDMALPPLDMVAEGLEAQTGRRFIKTHLPLDGMDYYPNAKYVFVGRDPRDVFMSMWNHHNKYSDGMRGALQSRAEEFGREFELDFKDIKAMWKRWSSESYFDWESDGYPYWSHLHHAQTWWDYRHVPNIAFVHFADLLSDPEKEVRRLAAYLDIAIDEAQLPGLLERISFGEMKSNFKNIMSEAGDIWRGGGDAFMNKGTNGRWRDILDADDLKLYEAAVARALSPDCAHWLEHGGAVSS